MDSIESRPPSVRRDVGLEPHRADRVRALGSALHGLAQDLADARQENRGLRREISALRKELDRGCKAS